MTRPLTVTEREEAFRERMKLDGDLAEWLAEQLADSTRLHFYEAGDFRMAYLEEAEELHVSDQGLLIRRESDGKFFLVEIEVTTRPLAMTS